MTRKRGGGVHSVGFKQTKIEMISFDTCTEIHVKSEWKNLDPNIAAST